MPPKKDHNNTLALHIDRMPSDPHENPNSSRSLHLVDIHTHAQNLESIVGILACNALEIVDIRLPSLDVWIRAMLQECHEVRGQDVFKVRVGEIVHRDAF